MNYTYHYNVDDLSYKECLEHLQRRNPKSKILNGYPPITYSEDENSHLMTTLGDLKLGGELKTYHIDSKMYASFLTDAGYDDRYPLYYRDNFPEKSLEHFIAYELLNLKEKENFVDIAAQASPHSEIFSRLSGCSGYMQDIMLPKGIHDNRIGGDATNLPVENNFFNAALLACSIEQFEGYADISLLQEMYRVLSPGGRLVLLPLYLHKESFYMTDPKQAIRGNVIFEDQGVDIRYIKDWGNRYARFYSPQSFCNRLIKPFEEKFNFTLYYVDNFREIDKSVYCRFVLMCQKIN